MADYQNEAIQDDLARIAQAANRLMARIHRTGACADPEQEIAYMQANLAAVRRKVSRG